MSRAIDRFGFVAGGDAAARELVLDEVLRDSVDGVFLLDRQRRVTYMTAGCERITGAHPTLLLGRECACNRLTDCRDDHGRSLGNPVLCPALKVIRGELPHYLQRMTIRHRSGRRVTVETSYSPVYDENGRVVSVVAIMRDITERQAIEELSSVYADDTAEQAAANGPVPEAETCVQTTEAEVLLAGNNHGGLLDRLLANIEKREILSALQRADGQRTVAAQLLGISRSRLYRRMGALGIGPGSPVTPAST